MIYDIIGDIHGHADKLIGLLEKLGYRHQGQYYQPPANHQAIFVGDFIDRGPAQLQTLQIVFDMIDAGVALAVMGNHEYNAIAYATAHPDGGYCRPHTARNTHQHQAFLAEAPFGSATHTYWLQRMYELPLWLDLPDLQVVHACWDNDAQKTLTPHLSANNCLNPRTVIASSTAGSAPYHAIENLLKGIEVALPTGMVLTDGQIIRHRTRVKWWLENWQTLPLAAAAQLGANTMLHPAADNQPMVITTPFRANNTKPTFIGHYWLTGTPAILSDSVVCTDYSAGGGGHLTAYQFDTDNPTLSDGKFVQYLGG